MLYPDVKTAEMTSTVVLGFCTAPLTTALLQVPSPAAIWMASFASRRRMPQGHLRSVNGAPLPVAVQPAALSAKKMLSRPATHEVPAPSGMQVPLFSLCHAMVRVAAEPVARECRAPKVL